MSAAVPRDIVSAHSITLARLRETAAHVLPLHDAPNAPRCLNASVIFREPPLGTSWFAARDNDNAARIVVVDASRADGVAALRRVVCKSASRRGNRPRLCLYAGAPVPELSLYDRAVENHTLLLSTPLAAVKAMFRMRCALLALSPAPEYGTVVSVRGDGILICGATGAGKSVLAQRLVAAGHALVADDAPLFHTFGTQVIATCPTGWYGRLMVAGNRMRDVRQEFGPRAFAASAPVRMIMHLLPVSDTTVDVVSPLWLSQRLLARTLPALVVPAHGRWAQSSIALAALAGIERIIRQVEPTREAGKYQCV